jgi:hypothetical protein
MQTQASGGSVSSSIRMFSAALLLAAKSMLQFVLADAFVVLFRFQVAFLRHINICDLNIPPQQPAKPEQRGIGES